MQIFDISVAIAPGETPIYPGDPTIEVNAWAAIARGDAANLSLLHFGAHTATHVDAPAHFIEGAATVATLPLDVLLGPAHVIDVAADKHSITADDVRALVPDSAKRVLFKTRNSAFWRQSGAVFREDFASIAPEAAHLLIERGVKLVGIDYLSVERFKSDTFATHLTLLAAGVVIIEGLDMSAVAAGEYELLCLPLKLAAGSGDGAPARAVLRTRD